MAKISTYPNDGNVSINDKLIGTDYENSNITKNFTVGSLAGFLFSQFGATLVLSAQSTVNQLPSALDTPLQVTFGAAQGTGASPVQLLSNGSIVFNQAGLYLFNGFANFERQGSSGGVTVTLFRALKNGIQILPTKGVELNTTGVMIPYELTIPFNAEAGDILTWEIMRDSSGTNAGGLYIHTNLGGWSNVPSADVAIWKIGG
jgi:hypothetical protein